MRTLIVDHEPHGRAALRQLCEANASIREVTVAECGATALQMIRSHQPDLLFLDVELKDMTGFDILRSLNQGGCPAVIMVATHHEHAIEALRAGAIDYLTKPIAASQFATALAKVHERHELPLTGVDRRPASDMAYEWPPHPPMRLIAENARRLYFLAPEDIDYIESCGDYVLIHIGEHKYIRRDTLKRLAAALRNLGFEWIKRAVLINIARVAFAEKLGHGALAFTLASGTRLVSRNRVKLQCARYAPLQAR